MGSPYRHPSHYSYRAQPPTGSSRWVVRLRSGSYVATIPAPPVLQAKVDPLRMQEEALGAPDIPAHQNHDGTYATGHHTQDDWGEETFGDVAGLPREKLHRVLTSMRRGQAGVFSLTDIRCTGSELPFLAKACERSVRPSSDHAHCHSDQDERPESPRSQNHQACRNFD